MKITPNIAETLEKKDNNGYCGFKGWEGNGFKLENVVEFEEKIKVKGQLGFWNYEVANHIN